MRIILPLLMTIIIYNFSTCQINNLDSITKHLEEVVISAQFTPRSEKNSIYKVKTIKGNTISAKASNNLKELLQQELNIDLSQNSVFGSSIELQGISKENIKILIDGIPIIGRLNGIIDLSQINLSNIDRIEVIEGPVSVFYGTDAMGGIINLISKKHQNNIIQGNITAYFESINATNLNANIGYKYGKNTMKLNGGNYRFKGLSTNKSPRNLNWEAKNQYFSDLQFIRKLHKLTLYFNNSFLNEKLISIGEPDRSGKIVDKDYYTRRINNSLNLKGIVFNNKFIDLTLSHLDYQRYHNTFDIDPVTFTSSKAESDNKIDNIVKFKYSGLKAQIGKSVFSDKLNYTFGTDLNNESTDGDRIFGKSKAIQTYALFSSINYKIVQNFELQPAIRYTYNSSYGSLISPAFNSKIRLNNNNDIRISYARGFRAPSLKELFLDFHISVGPFTYNIYGNENLEVEKSHSLNLQYTFNKPLNKTKSITLESSVFYNDISNLIALSELVEYTRNYINIANFKSVGGKIDFSYNNIDKLSIKTGISIVGRFNKYSEDYASEKFLYSPELISNINYQIKPLDINFNLFYKYTGKRSGFYIENGTGEIIKTSREQFNNMDLSLSKSFIKNKLNISLGVKNIFDIQDIETTNNVGEAHSRDIQLWGRSYFLKTSFSF